MYTKTFESDLRVWLEVAKSSLHSGNKVGSARLHALQMMIDTRRGWSDGWSNNTETKYRPMLETISRLCEFGKEIGTANEKNIFIHIIIDLMESALNELVRQEEREKHAQRLADAYPDGKDFEEPYPTEDSAARLSNNGDIPF